MFLCGIFVDLETHYIASESFETFHTSPNHCLLMEKLSLIQWWCTAETFLEFTCGSNNIALLSFMYLNFWKFANFHEITWIFAKMIESVCVVEKTLFGLPRSHLCYFPESPRFHLYSFQGLSLWYLCWFGNSLYRIRIIWNFPRITESLPFDG